MIRLYLLTMVCLSTVAGARAQVTLDLVLDQDQYLPGEPLVAKARITNFSGRTLKLGTAEDWLTFNIEFKGKLVPAHAPLDILGEFTLENSEIGTRKVDVAAGYDLSRPGRYAITATLRIPDFNQLVFGKTREFDIVPGSKLWELTFGMPVQGEAATQESEVRKYALIQANHLKRPKLYLRVANAAETVTYRVVPLPAMVSFANPDRQVDKQARLHLLYQTGARSFHYAVISPDGEMLVRQTFDHSDTRPRLRPDRDGGIQVAGGLRRISTDDLPPPVAARTSIDAKPAQP